jgi:glycosyltransferase involved in cell wall biosynthesis
MIAWTHDLAAGNPDYALPNANRPPWSLVRTTSPHVAYVTVSDRRAAEIEDQLKPPVSAVVVPDPLDHARLFGLSAEVVALLPSLGLAERDFIFLLPAPIAPRKNLDFALSVIRQLCDLDRDPLLLVTGPAAAGQERYADFVRQSLPRELRGHVVFLSDYFLVRDDILRDLYLLADCLLLPAVREGFGLPVIEAAAFRLPIWGQEIPAFQALAAEGAAFLLDGISRVPEAVEWLESQTTFRQQRLVRRAFDPAAIYHDYYRPLLGLDGSAPLQNHP